MLCPIFKAAQNTPHAPAIISSQKILSYQQFNTAIDQMVVHLQQKKIKYRQQVAIVCSNTIDEIILLWALWRMGAVACLLSPRSPQKNLETQKTYLNCTELKINHVYTPAAIGQGQLLLGRRVGPTPKLNLSTITNIILTSGSTGTPKAVVHTFGNHYYSALGSNRNLPLKRHDRWLLSLPLYHVSGLSILFRCALAGSAVVIPPKDLDLAENLKHFKITHTSLVTTQLIPLLNTARSLKTLKALKAILLGGGPIPESFIQKAQRVKLPIYMTYGLSEMTSQVATSQKGGTVVKILPYRSLKINKKGEIYVKGKTRFPGYYQKGTMLKPFDAQGWFKTGDLGQYDKLNGLKILGRKDRMFISGGENTYPEEIERAILQTGLVDRVNVIAEPDPIYGKRPKAFIQFMSKRTTTTQLDKQLRQILPGYKIPKDYIQQNNLKTKL